MKGFGKPMKWEEQAANRLRELIKKFDEDDIRFSDVQVGTDGTRKTLFLEYIEEEE